MPKRILLCLLITLTLSACSFDVLTDIIDDTQTDSVPVEPPADSTQTYVEGDACYSQFFLPARGLSVGGQAITQAPGVAAFAQSPATVDLRADHTSLTSIESIPVGETVAILDGPYCFATRNAQNRWWRVQVERTSSTGYVDEYAMGLNVLNIYLDPVVASIDPVSIRHFAVSVADTFGGPAQPGETVYVSWDVIAAASVTVSRQDTGAIIGDGLHNSIPLVAPDNAASLNVTLVAVSADGAQIEQTETLIIDCPACGQIQTDIPTIQLAYQSFEGGFMIYQTDTRQIYVLYNSGAAQTFADTWQGETFDAGAPPEGRIQPQFGFGAVWTNQPGVRDRLGWATGGESYYTSTITLAGSTDLQLPDGRHIIIESGAWRFAG